MYRTNGFKLCVALLLGVIVFLALLMTGYTIWSSEHAKLRLREARDEWEQLAEQRMFELQQREKKFRAIFSQTSQLMAVLDTEGILLEVNRAALEAVDFNEDDFIGKPFWEGGWWKYTSDEMPQKIKDTVKRVAAGEQVVPASELAAAMKQIKELQRLLGKKTMENELLKEAVEYGRAKKWIAHAPLLPGDGE